MRTLRSLTIAAALTAIAATGCIQPNDDVHPAARAIPTSDVAMIAYAGHLPHIERLDDTHAAIAAFLAD